MQQLSETGERVFNARLATRDVHGTPIETFEEAVIRISNTAASAEKSHQDYWAQNFAASIGSLLFIPSTPIWANIGKVDRPWQPSACFVLAVEDSLDSMYKTLADTAMVFKSGGGVGYNFSTIRPKGSLVHSTKGRASGVVELIKLYNASSDMVMQGGVRRGASMGILNVDHPEIIDFLNAKRDGGLTNFNLSVGITDVLSVAAWALWGWWNKNRMIRFMKQRYSSRQGTAEIGNASSLKKLIGTDGVILGSNGRRTIRFSQRASCEHTAIIGPTGCGKTTRFFIPNLLDLPPGASAIVTDPKGEMAKITAPILRSRGFNVHMFHPHEPYNPQRSMIYNPLQLAKSDTEVSELAEIMIRNGYFASGQAGDTQWISFSQPLWEAALLAIRQREEIPCIADAYEIIATMTEEDRSEEFKQVGGVALDRYLTYLQSAQSPETSASIRTVLLSSVRNFVRPDIAAVVNGQASFNMSELRRKPTVFFIQVPERKAHLMKPLTATMYWQIIEHIMDEDGCPIFFFLDEFPNIGQIPGFSQLAATARSRGISLNIGIQGVEQLAREYSREDQVDILNNMKTKIYFPGSTGEAGSQVANLGGYSTMVQDGMAQRKELLTADELRRIPDDSVLVLAHNLNPVLLSSVPYFKKKGVWPF